MTSDAPRESLRARLAMGAAVVVHAAALAVATRWPVASTPRTVSVTDPGEAVEISVESEVVETNGATGPKAGTNAPAQSKALARAERSDGRAAATSSIAAIGPSSSTAPSEEAPAAAGSEAPVMLFAPPAVVATPGDNPLLGAVARDTSTPNEQARRRVERSMTDHARDAAMGLGPEGPVLRALHDGTRASLAPERGRATFIAAVDAAGIVVSLRLVGSTGGTAGWNDARDHAARALEGTRLALRGARGATLTIEVESDMRLPSGAKAGVTASGEKSVVALPENAPSHGASDVVQTYTVGRFDLADVGAKPRRVVHARLVSIGAL